MSYMLGHTLLLEDHQSKLSLGNYTTFQVTRTLNDGRDYASYIDLMMSSPGDSYHLTKEESTKHVDIDHLCAASRVSHQFRLNRNKDGDTDMVDVKLKVSHNMKEPDSPYPPIKGEKHSLISRKPGNSFQRTASSKKQLEDLHKYEKLRGDIAKLLDKQHCAKLGVFFELKPAENDTIQEAAESGKMLMKILDERELIMPERMIGMYEGLKAIHFNKVARLVLEYIGKISRETGNPFKKEPKLSVNFKILIEEGYKRLDVQRALKLSHGKLDLGRRLLLLAKEEHERLPLFPGPIFIKNNTLISMVERVIAGVISACTSWCTTHWKDYKSVKWSLERKHLSCSMNSQHLAVEAEKPCLIGLHVPYIPKSLKRVCVLPIVNRVSESGDQLTIHLWFHNDDSLEHKSLINEEIYQQKGSIIHDPVFVQLNSMTSNLHVSTNSSTSQCNPSRVDVAMEILWLNNRHKVEFHLQNKEIKDTVNLEIEARYGLLRRNLFQLSMQLQIENLRHSDQITSPFQLVLPESIITSFDQLKQNLSKHLDVDQSTLLANIFQLSEEGITDIKEQKHQELCC
ncbi:hypothetical protein BSL78_13837 [Apostichopus japonicus]|uniref:Uncharacterized protein n=1 Tax=Stichopus japonicus TaxID=307972 RepID=A0A2G8KMN2_STIJA|nr:hypothetical protein BSL78_13837 [Apostichopus japonicus]